MERWGKRQADFMLFNGVHVRGLNLSEPLSDRQANGGSSVHSERVKGTEKGNTSSHRVKSLQDLIE